jgi:outer membrane protein insertion porin family
MLQMKTFSGILIGACLFTACSTTRTVPKDDKLYTGARVEIKDTTSLPVRQKKVLRTDLQGLTRPRPNTRFLGIPFKLMIYNMFGNRKDSSFFGKLRNRWGEPPVLLSAVDLQRNVKVLQSHLENKGFFKANVTGDTLVAKRKAHAKYRVNIGEQYKIASVTFPQDTSDLSHHMAHDSAKSLLKVGAPFDLDLIKGERIRIDAHLKEDGFYYFSPEYVLVRVDSTIGDNKVALYVRVKEDAPAVARRIHRINNVFIYSNYSLATARSDTNRTDAKEYEGYNIIDRQNTFKPRLLARMMQFQPGEVYNRTEHNLTLNRLINLNVFKFVKNRFEPVPGIDTPLLNAFYYLTPLPKKSLRGEITGTQKSNGFTGSELTFTWHNRNTARGAEHLNISFYVGSEIQSGARTDTSKIPISESNIKGNTYRFGTEVALTLPKFLVPFVEIPNQGGFAPRTNIRLGYEALNKRKLYTLNSFRGQYGFTWKQNIRRNNELNPISINYVQPLNETPLYEQRKAQFPTLARATERQFILGSNYQFTYNDFVQATQPPKAFFINGLLDLSGNIAGLITGANAKRGDTVKLFGSAFAQYVKFEGDGRYYHKIGLNNTWANRIIIGYGLPYGNSLEIPFIKQFFVGGNNSLRGFRSRSIGPGTYRDTSIRAEFLPEQTGDIKFEVNTELRPRISGPLYGALFIDAGNVWLKNDERWTGKPGSQFTGKFLSQLAVDAGVGIRLDIQLFVIRFDVAVPLRKPWEQNPWVTSNINLGNQGWRQTNIVYNFAIGYPF